MLKRIERLLREECRIEPGDVLIAGVSGGPDSLCMLQALLELGHRPIVAHFDHQLRSESSGEVGQVEKYAASQGLPFVPGKGDVASYSSSKSVSVEEAGRKLRYRFLLAQARDHDAAAVAVGHTADDQAETVLMHMLRGAGLAGLAGMSPRVVLPEFDEAIPIVRPLLKVWRHETVEYCRLHGLRPVYDSSNDSRAFLRNRVRGDLIPKMEAYNPQIRQALVRLSDSAAEDLALIENLVSVALNRTLVDRGPGYLEFDAKTLAAELPAVQRRLIMRAALELQPEAEPDFDGLRRAQAFISDSSARRLQIGDGLTLYHEPGIILLALDGKPLPTEAWPQLPDRTIALGRDDVADVGLSGTWKFSWRVNYGESGDTGDVSANDAYLGRLDADALPEHLELRSPRPGDRIKPLGLKGHSQKLSDIFINLGIPERLRARWPVLASDAEVVWIPGFRIAERYRVQESTRRSVIVSVNRPR